MCGLYASPPRRHDQDAAIFNSLGHYVIRWPPVEIDGVSQFTIQATGKACGGTFQRYKHFSRYIGKKLD